jgi:hypothetical protein
MTNFYKYLSFTLIAALMMVGVLAIVPDNSSAQTGASLVVFSADRLGNYDLFSLDPATGSLTNLTEGEANDVDPSVSPDGNWVVFASDGDGDFDLYYGRVDGTEVSQLTSSDYNDRQPRFVGNESVVFSRNFNGQWDLFMIAISSGETTRLTNDSFVELGPDYGLGEADVVAVPETTDTAETTETTDETVDDGGEDTADTSEPAGTPDATVSGVNRLNLRQSPGTGAEVVVVVERGAGLTVIGRLNNNSWLQVTTETGETGWAFTPYLTVNISYSTVPVVDAAYVPPSQ